MNPDFTIIGGGIAGLTAAIALQQKGLSSSIFEAASEIKAVGAGLALAANAMRGFDHLGLMDEVVALGRLLPSFSIFDQSGKCITKADSQAVSRKYGLDNFLIHRATLHRFLVSKIDPNHVFTNKKAISFQYIQDKIEVSFEDGTSHLTDYLIVADGIHSAIRKQLLPTSHPRYAGYTCWRAVIDNNDLDISESSETWGRKGRFGIAPLANRQLYWFACINAPQDSPEMKAFDVKDLWENFRGYHQPVPDILEKTLDEQLIWNDIIDLEPLAQYAFGKVLLIGDAGHATTPNLGQGACQAIEDAVVLADEIAACPDIQNAFQAFEKRRLKRTHYITNTSWQLGRIAQMDSPFLSYLRNIAFRALPSRLKEKQMDKVFRTDF